MRHRAGVNELGEDRATGCVDRIGDGVPTVNLFGSEQTWHVDKPDAIAIDPGRLRQNEARRGALPVILNMQIRRDQADVARSSSCHGRHDDPVPQRLPAEYEGVKEWLS